jgi:hypothetical protein
MKGRARFTAQEAAEIRRLLGLIRRAEPGHPQKRLRDQLRALGFYITDWAGGPAGFTISDFDDLVAHGLVKVEGERVRPAAEDASPPEHATRHPGRPADPSTGSTPATRPSSGTLTDEALTGNALKSLSMQPMSIAAAFDGGMPNSAGIYAIYGQATVWQQLRLGAPPDDRPLYVGKAEASLRSRDLSTHFATGRTGQSSPRRSFAALLAAAGTLDLQPCPRRPHNPEARKWTHYALEPAGDQQLTAWMSCTSPLRSG